MYWDVDHYILIGTLNGDGYQCQDGSMAGNLGLWNKVSHWVDWIQMQMVIKGETTCGHKESPISKAW